MADLATKPVNGGDTSPLGTDRPIEDVIFEATGGAQGNPSGGTGSTIAPVDGLPGKLGWVTNFGDGSHQALQGANPGNLPPKDPDAEIKLTTGDDEAVNPFFTLFDAGEKPRFANGGPEGVSDGADGGRQQGSNICLNNKDTGGVTCWIKNADTGKLEPFDQKPKGGTDGGTGGGTGGGKSQMSDPEQSAGTSKAFNDAQGLVSNVLNGNLSAANVTSAMNKLTGGQFESTLAALSNQSGGGKPSSNGATTSATGDGSLKDAGGSSVQTRGGAHDSQQGAGASGIKGGFEVHNGLDAFLTLFGKGDGPAKEGKPEALTSAWLSDLLADHGLAGLGDSIVFEEFKLDPELVTLDLLEEQDCEFGLLLNDGSSAIYLGDLTPPQDLTLPQEILDRLAKYMHHEVLA